MEAYDNTETLSEEERWEAVLQRDPRYDGAFVYAVRSTGIFCRPTCPSRRPGRAQVSFFERPAAAARAGFRPCRRCQPERGVAPTDQVALAGEICRYIEAHQAEPLTLEGLGAQFHLSPTHLQRLVKGVVGLSPQQYLESCRLARVRAALQAGETIAGALYGAGWGSTSRLYSRANAHLGMTPGNYREGGAGSRIAFAIAPCPLGHLLVGATARGICAVALGESVAGLEAELRREFPAAELVREEEGLRPWLQEIVAHLAGEMPHLALPLDVQATAFQRQVWEALQAIPYGETRSYSEIAESIGRPSAARAVARACATNPAALLIPCHRVVGKDGSLSGYRWGLDRKAALLRREKG